jgi:PIN domain nuclease of toxin-antitoxin system
MNYLLDTHYVLWTLFEPKLLDAQVKEIFSDENQVKYVSGISLWEISLKFSLGKLDFESTNPDEIHQKIVESGFHIISIENELFSSYYKLPKKENHRDPFDRMLIWQAIHNDFIVISKDNKFTQYTEDGLRVCIGT